MIVDIVPLPRRLSKLKLKKHASITSESTMCLPVSNLHRIYGYWEPDDTSFMMFGGIHKVITGDDAPFRYKLIEPTKFGIAEYFVMTTSPINVRQPYRSKNVALICPWVNLVDMRTFKTRKFILWRGIFDLMHYETEDNITDVPVDAVIINELRNLATLHDRPDILASLSEYPKLPTDLLISEETMDRDSDIDALLTLGSNIAAYNSLVGIGDYNWCEPCDVFRGVRLPDKCNKFPMLQGCMALNHFIHGKVTLSELKHLFGITYDTHAFQRIFVDRGIHPYTELSIYEDCDPDMFEVLKYIERLPYSEFVINVDNNGKCKISLFNQYDICLKLDTIVSGKEADLIADIGRHLLAGHANMARATVERSWSEDAYITITMTDDTQVRYYFDLVSASLGTRSLMRDYSGQLF